MTCCEPTTASHWLRQQKPQQKPQQCGRTNQHKSYQQPVGSNSRSRSATNGNANSRPSGADWLPRTFRRRTIARSSNKIYRVYNQKAKGRRNRPSRDTATINNKPTSEHTKTRPRTSSIKDGDSRSDNHHEERLHGYNGKLRKHKRDGSGTNAIGATGH